MSTSASTSFGTVQKFAAALAVVAFARAVTALPVDYRLSVDGVFDNREYCGQPPLVDQTFFLIRPEAEVGFLLDGNNKIRAGLMYTQEFGAPEATDNLHLLAYYHYHNKDRMQFRFGAFPRKNVLELPPYFLGDEFAYSRPYVHGALFDVRGGGGGLLLWVDWVGRQTAEVNEAFLFGGSVDYRRGAFFARYDAIMYHRSNTRPAIPGAYVYDNGGMSAEAGASWSKAERIDSLSASIGIMAAFDRRRDDDIWRKPVGYFLTGYAAAGFIALRGFAYAGQPQLLTWGEGYFNVPEWADTYTPYRGTTTILKLDLIGRLLRRERVTADLSNSFYLFNGNIGYSQHFVLRAEIGNEPQPQKKKKGFRINIEWD